YRSIIEAFVDVWKRFRPDQFSEAQKHTGFVIEIEAPKDKISSLGLSGELEGLLKKASETSTTKEVKELSKAFEEKAKAKGADTSSLEDIKKYAESKANTNFGTRKEKKG